MSRSVTGAAAAAPTIDGGKLERMANLHVLRVSGSDYEMAFQHGRLLADEVRRGPLPYYRSYMDRTLADSGLGSLRPLIWPALRQLLGRRVAAAMPDSTRETLQGLADGAGLSFEEVLDGATMPDAFLWLVARWARLKRVPPAVIHRLALEIGCTSAIAWDGATMDGRLLHARNMDYHGVACWPATALATFHNPSDGQRYVSVGAAGIPLAGFTAMNQAGLTLAVHQHMFTHRTAFGGIPIGPTGDRIMRHAESLEDARRILGEQRPIGCWTYFIACGRSRRVLCWEEDPRRRAAREIPRERSVTAYSNIYLDRQLGATEVDIYPSYWRHNLGRYRRAHALLEERPAPLDAAAMAAILGDTGSDPRCRLRDAIGMLMTVSSVVFRPEDGVFWVGTGEAPVSRNRFLPFSLAAQGAAAGEAPLAPAADATDAAATRAFVAYRQAYVAAIDHRDLDGALRRMRVAVELEPRQPLYQLLLGLLALKVGWAREAYRAFEHAIDLRHPDAERRSTARLWRGRASDLLGRREAALDDYRYCLGRPADPAVRRAALRGLRRVYTPAQARRVEIDFTFADVINP
jgi:tetratricopeptide (TPR) repeat protein